MHLRILFAAGISAGLLMTPSIAQTGLAGGDRPDSSPVAWPGEIEGGVLTRVGGPTRAKRGPAEPVLWLHVLHNNDGESQLINAGPGALADFGSIARFATLANQLRAEALTFPVTRGAVARGSLLISSGDNFLAGPEFNASLTNGIPFFDSIGLDLVGYDAFAIGNHEFDFGPDVLAQFIEGFTGPAKFLSANLDFSNEPNMQALVEAGRVARSQVVEVAGVQVGIVGATTTNLPFISSPRNTIINTDLVTTIQSEVDALTALGVKIIILTSHLQGLDQEFALAPHLRDVDIIIGGGGGELLANPGDLLVPGDTPWPTNLGGAGYPRVAQDADGRTVPVVTTRGDYRYIGRLIAGFDADGNLIAVDSTSGVVRVSGVAPDAVQEDAAILQQVVDPVRDAVDALANNAIGVSLVDLDGRTTSVRAFETNLGNLIADAFLWEARRRAATFGVALADVAIANGGGIRNNSVIPFGVISELNTFEILPFSNFVSVVASVPPAQFKEILENAVSRVGGSGNGRFGQIAGLHVEWDFTGVAQQIDPVSGVVVTPGTRVRTAVLDDGRVIVQNGQISPGAPSVNVATVDFLARGGDQYPFRGLPFTTLGVSYQQALRNYIQTGLGSVILPIDYREGGEGRIIRRN